MIFYTGTAKALEDLNRQALEKADAAFYSSNKSSAKEEPIYKRSVQTSTVDNDLVLEYYEFEDKIKYDDKIFVNYKNASIFHMAKTNMEDLGLVVDKPAEDSLEEKYRQAITEVAAMLMPKYKNILVIDKTIGWSEKTLHKHREGNAITRAATAVVQQKISYKKIPA